MNRISTRIQQRLERHQRANANLEIVVGDNRRSDPFDPTHLPLYDSQFIAYGDPPPSYEEAILYKDAEGEVQTHQQQQQRSQTTTTQDNPDSSNNSQQQQTTNNVIVEETPKT